MRDLDVEQRPAGSGRQAAGTKVAKRAPVAEPQPPPEEEPLPQRDPAADLAPEDLVLKDTPRQQPKRRRSTQSGKRRKHGRSR